MMKESRKQFEKVSTLSHCRERDNNSNRQVKVVGKEKVNRTGHSTIRKERREIKIGTERLANVYVSKEREVLQQSQTLVPFHRQLQVWTVGQMYGFVTQTMNSQVT